MIVCYVTGAVKVATEVVGTGAGIIIEMEVLGQIDITMVEIVHAHTETSSIK